RVRLDEPTPLVSRTAPVRPASGDLGGPRSAPLSAPLSSSGLGPRPRIESGVQERRAPSATGLELQAISRRPRSMPQSLRPERSLWKALSPSLALFVLSVAITVLDRTFA